MSLLDKVLRRGAIGLALFGFWACDDPNDMGLELDPGEAETQVLFEELMLKASTIYLDSLRTDDGDFLMFGANEDPTFGSVQVTGYSEIEYRNGTIPSDTLDPQTATFYMEVNDILTSNTFIEQNVEVRLTTQDIFESAIYLADESLPTLDTLAGTWEIVIGKSDSIYSFDVGPFFRDILWNRVVTSSNIADLQFGIELRPTDSNGGITSIDISADSTFFHFESKGQDTTIFDTFFTLQSQFHNIARDRTGSLIESLANSGDSITDQENSYINSLAGVYTKIDITPLQSFIDRNPSAIINSANLEIPVIEGRLNNLSEQIQQISFLFETSPGKINGPGLIDDIANSALAPDEQYGDGRLPISLRVVDLNDDPLNYNESITLFAQFSLENRTLNDEFLTSSFVLVPSDRVSLEQSGIDGSGISLKLFYTIVNQ